MLKLNPRTNTHNQNFPLFIGLIIALFLTGAVFGYCLAIIVTVSKS